MRIAHTKIITILIAGAMFTAGLLMGFGGYVFAGQNYNSSKSNTSSIGKIHEYVGNILLPYGIGGMEINRVNDALDVGITEDALIAMLGEILGNAGSGATSGQAGAGQIEKIQAILLEFDKLGIGSIDKESAEGVSQPGAGQIEKGVSTPDAGGTPRAGFKEVSGIGSETESIEIKDGDDLPATKNGTIKDMLPSGRAEPAPAVTTPTSLKAREAARQSAEIIRENAKELRENFRENVKTTIGHVDHGKTARVAVAHGKGLRMVNRYRSAIARFDHILGRMESRIDKIGIEIARSETGNIKDYFPGGRAVQLIEEAKNMQVLNEAKLVELEAKYESLLLGENPGGVAEEVFVGDFTGDGRTDVAIHNKQTGDWWVGRSEEAREIAKELKAEIENLHAKLRQIANEIRQAATDYNSSISQ